VRVSFWLQDMMGNIKGEYKDLPEFIQADAAELVGQEIAGVAAN
jgi:hypothetical protein